MVITKLEQLVSEAQKRGKRRFSVAYGQDENTLTAVSEAVKLGFIEAIITGDEKEIKQTCEKLSIDFTAFEILNEPDEMKAGILAAQVINEGKADIFMKGLISTDKYLRCILNKETGLMPKGKNNVLTHVMVAEAPKAYHKLMIASDCAFIPEPDLNQKIAIVNYQIQIANSLGIEVPKIAVIAFTEKANPKVQACIEAALLAKMGDRGQFKNCIIDGPLALDVAINMDAVKIKKVKSAVAGDADCLLFHNLEAGNVFYKAITKLVKAEAAAIVAGAKVPAILPSRGDSELSKLYSIALACLMVK
jgi:phosphate butyryltransferase